MEPQSMFLKTFGATPLLKTIDFLIEYEGFDYSKCQVAKEIGISRVTIEPIWDKLIKMNFIVKTRVIGRAEMYKLNIKNPTVRALIEFDLKLSGIEAKKELVQVRNR